MSLSALILAVSLSQVGAEAPAAPPPPSADARAAAAAEKAAEAAQKAAEQAAAAAEKAADVAQRLADALAPPAPPKAAAPEEKKKDHWAGSVGAGLTFITGNSQTLTLTGNASADRKWDAWGLGLRLSGAYGLANPTANVSGSTAAVTALRAAGTLRGDRSFGGFASLFALVGAETDHMKNLESRSIGELGTGLTFFNTKQGDLEKLYLRLDLALRAGYETDHQYYPTPAAIDPYGLVILAPRAALTLRWNFSKDVRFSEEIEAIPFLLAPTAGRLLINNTTKLNAQITETLSLVTALVINYDSSPPQAAPPPAPQRLSTDVALTVGLEATL